MALLLQDISTNQSFLKANIVLLNHTFHIIWLLVTSYFKLCAPSQSKY